MSIGLLCIHDWHRIASCVLLGHINLTALCLSHLSARRWGYLSLKNVLLHVEWWCCAFLKVARFLTNIGKLQMRNLVPALMSLITARVCWLRVNAHLSWCLIHHHRLLIDTIIKRLLDLDLLSLNLSINCLSAVLWLMYILLLLYSDGLHLLLRVMKAVLPLITIYLLNRLLDSRDIYHWLMLIRGICRLGQARVS